ncbi:hypothetical protein NCAS_0B07950 [Naumovozyma castellii]|uniref:Protein PET10 n=1 Tax=Naumovozyma castellii TaxID=27288 RepID=G0VAE9_NAUCA|nr:hypothetical protein NCAS_0B07950 [Naumovozyma castellii CBS 4309]CCC68879.1 hypothetical protein NCAS_0B07950 [Naumovozyma castellii CBS 4309]
MSANNNTDSNEPPAKETSVVQFNSAVFTHLHRYPVVSKLLTKVDSLPLVGRTTAFLANAGSKFHQRSPAPVKTIINKILLVTMALDQLVNLLVFKEGIDAFLTSYKNHSNKLGVWIAWFIVDYFANIFNMILTEFLIKPFHLKANENAAAVKNTEGNLPHLAKLTNTTKSLTTDLQSKVQSNLQFVPSKDETLERIDTYIKPTYEMGRQTYKMVSDSYETNLSKSESVPRAIVSTGIDLGNFTIEKLKSVSTTATSTEDSTPVPEQQPLQATQ